MKNLLNKTYEPISTPKDFVFELQNGKIVRSNDPQTELLTMYAETVRETTGFTPTPKEAHTLLTNMHEYLLDPDEEIESCAEEQIYKNIRTYAGLGAPKRVGMLGNIHFEDISAELNAKRELLQDTPENKQRMNLISIAEDLSLYESHLEWPSVELKEEYNVTKADVKRTAVELVKHCYPALPDKHIPALLTNLSIEGHLDKNVAYNAFISGDIKQVEAASKRRTPEVGLF